VPAAVAANGSVPVHVFISHSSKDKPAVEALAVALRDRCIDPWLDKWEIGAGDDIVASINAGLDQAGAGIIVFSRHSKESRWVEAEVSYLTYARIQEQKVLIPVMLGEDCFVPPLLRPLARRGIEEIDAIADALLHRKAKPILGRPPEQGRRERVLVTLRRDGAAGVRAELRIGAQQHGEAVFAALPNGLAEAQAAFLQGFRHGLRRDAAAAAQLESNHAQIARLGNALGELCLPGNSGTALAALIDGCPVGTIVEICWEADRPELLGLPFEATCSDDASTARP
jgi:hypothetical protein